jgi:hypothetical protein
MKIATGRLTTTLKYIGFSFVFAAAAGLFAPSARAGELMDWLAGVAEGEDRIEYPERAPLVVPPALKLPAPKTSAAATNPAWPKDPDLEKKRKANEAAAAKPRDPGKPLTVEEIRAGRIAGANMPTSEEMNRKDPSRPLTPQEMQALNEEFARKRQEEAAAALTPTGRAYLTDPPTPYRQRATLTPEMEAQAAAAGSPVNGKPWYQFW